MAKDWLCSEVLKAVFPLLDGKDLASCMLVCHQWRDIARDDYLWKCICAKRWPSICKGRSPGLSYYNLFVTFSRPESSHPLPPARLSFDQLDFYFDVWLEQTPILSEVVSGAVLKGGMKNPPARIPGVIKNHLDGADHKMIMQVEPVLTLSLGERISVSVLLARRDTNTIACIANQSAFDYIDVNAFRALAYEYLKFSPGHPFIPGTRAWVSLLFSANDYNNIVDVFGIEIDFCEAANSENEVPSSRPLNSTRPDHRLQLLQFNLLPLHVYCPQNSKSSLVHQDLGFEYSSSVLWNQKKCYKTYSHAICWNRS